MAQAQQSRAQAPEPSRSVGPRRARRPHSPRRPDRRPTSLSRRLPAFWKPYRIVIEGLVDAAYVVGLEGRIILGNAALVHLTAYPLVELLGRPATELYMPEALPILLTRHAVALEDVPLPARLQTEIVSKDGYHIPVELAMTAIFDGDRRVGSMSVVRDLSERYQAEAQVRALIESIPDAMIGVRENGRIALVNTQTEQLFGFPRAELLGRSIATLLQERRRPSQQAHRRHYGPAPRGQAMETELYGVRKDSSAFLVEVSLSPLLTAKGMLTLRMVRDISERRLAEDSFARLAAIVVSSNDAIGGEALDGTITTWNRAAERLFGYAPTEIFGRPLTLLVPSDRMDEIPKLFARLRRGEQIEHYETVWMRKDGTSLDVSITMFLIRVGTGHAIGAAAIIHDITARKHEEAALQASVQEKEALLKEVHHRIKNNLAVIAGLLYLQSTYTDDAQAVEILRYCQDRVRSIALVHEILYHSAYFTAVDFREYIQALVPQLWDTYTLPDSRIQLLMDLEKVELDIETAVPCGLILNELITNVVKHAFPDGRPGEVRIVLRVREDGTVLLRVVDNGVGLPADFDEARTMSLGIRLIRILTNQVHGQCEFVRTSPGLEVCLIFRRS